MFVLFCIMCSLVPEKGSIHSIFLWILCSKWLEDSTFSKGENWLAFISVLFKTLSYQKGLPNVLSSLFCKSSGKASHWHCVEGARLGGFIRWLLQFSLLSLWCILLHCGNSILRVCRTYLLLCCAFETKKKIVKGITVCYSPCALSLGGLSRFPEVRSKFHSSLKDYSWCSLFFFFLLFSDLTRDLTLERGPTPSNFMIQGWWSRC